MSTIIHANNQQFFDKIRLFICHNSCYGVNRCQEGTVPNSKIDNKFKLNLLFIIFKA
jgi:hypothetical protein